MFVSQTLNELAKLALIASDDSYFTAALAAPSTLVPLRDTPAYDILPMYTTMPGFNKISIDSDSRIDSIGFKFVAYRNETTNEVIVAFGGTDGHDPVDWTGNTALGWNQWNEGRALVFALLRDPGFINADTKVHFTGQSLGGALAQYAAYEWVQKKLTITDALDPEFMADFNKQNVSLTTFNGLGGLKGLTDHVSYDRTVLQGLGLSGHFYVTNDLVSRLGGGHVGGDTFLLDFKSGTINPQTLQPYAYGLVDAHRIETGFYANLRPGAPLEFQVSPGTSPIAYLNVDSVQDVAALFGNLLNNKNLGLVESRFRFVGAMTAGLTIGSPSDVNTLTQALITSLHDSGDLSDSWFRKFSGVNWGAIFIPARPVTGALAILSTLGAVFTDAVQGAATGISTIFQAIGDYVGAGSRPDITVMPLPSIEVASRQLQFEILMASMGAVPRLAELTASLPPGLDPEALAAQMLSGGSADWLPKTLAFARAQANTAGQTPAQLAVMTTQLVTALNHRIEALQEATPEEKVQLVAQLNTFTQDTAQGFAKAYSDFLQGVAGSFDLGRVLSFLDINLIDQAYAAELSDPRLSSSVKMAIEDAREIVQQAGQTVVVQQGIEVNPFTTPGFIPDTAPLATGTVREDGANVFTVYLPYAAGTGGQAVQLKLNGPGATTVTVLSNGQELTPQNGTVILLVPEGQQQLFFVLRAQDLGANSTLSLAGQLVDMVNGTAVATHLEHPEATVSLVSTDINYDNGRPVSTVSNRSYTELENDHNYIYTAIGEGTIATRGGNDQIYGSSLGEFMTGGSGHDRINGGGGNDTILGGSYFLAQQNYVLPFEEADGNDFVDGQGGDDTIEGDGGNDRLFGDAGTLVYGSYGSPPGGDDLLDGGAGDKVLHDNGNDDVLLGGKNQLVRNGAVKLALTR